MKNTFTAIDFGTAHGYRWSICQIGLVRVEDCVITKETAFLVQPPDNYYWNKLIAIHGITPHDTANEPTFDELWHLIEPYITDQTVVAHNGISFDFPVMEQTIAYYGMRTPHYLKACTYRIYRDNLASLCRTHSIPLNHHDALSDARACAELYLMHLKEMNE